MSKGKRRNSVRSYIVAAGILCAASLFQGCASPPASQSEKPQSASVQDILAMKPTVEEDAKLTYAPDVPPPVTRREAAVVKVSLETKEVVGTLMEGVEKPTTYRFWTFGGHVPGPFIRLRVGDVMELHFSNDKASWMPHNVDFHAVTGPGGGAKITTTAQGQTTVARFKMLNPGLFVYHCATPPIPHHIANGMYGLILVEPLEGLPKVDKEFYVMESEFYTKGKFGEEGLQDFAPEKAEVAQPDYVVFNGSVGSMTGDHALKAKKGDTVRLFVGNGGPNLVSSFHLIGDIFDKVYREGALSNPEENVQTTLVPAGGSTVVEFKLDVPGDYIMVDHSIFRIEKGALGILHADGEDEPEIYKSGK